MIEIWNQIKTIVFQRSFFKVPFWIWFGPVFVLVLTAFMVKLQPSMIPLAVTFSLIGIFLSAEFKLKGVAVGTVLLGLFSLIFYKNLSDPVATYWLYTFGLATAFIITSYSVEEYESFVFSQAEEAKKNSEDVKLWQNRFEGNQLRLEREKERFENLAKEFERQEDGYLEKIDQLEKMFHSSSYELKAEQNRGYNLHQELRKILIQRYELEKEVEVVQSKLETLKNGYEAELNSKQIEIETLTSQLLNAQSTLKIAHTDQHSDQELITPALIIEEAEKLQLIDVKVEAKTVESNDEEENIYFSSY